MEQEHDQLKSLRDKSDALIMRSYITWGIRWTIGLLLIWVVTSKWDGLTWLWYTAAVIAPLSLMATIYFQRKLKKQFSSADAGFHKLNDALIEAEEKE